MPYSLCLIAGHWSSNICGVIYFFQLSTTCNSNFIQKDSLKSSHLMEILYKWGMAPPFKDRAKFSMCHHDSKAFCSYSPCYQPLSVSALFSHFSDYGFFLLAFPWYFCLVKMGSHCDLKHRMRGYSTVCLSKQILVNRQSDFYVQHQRILQ